MSTSLRTLGELLEIQNGFAFNSSLFNDIAGVPLIRIRDLERSRTETYYSGEFDEKYVVRNGDYLIGMDGDFRCVVWQGGDALLNQRVCKLMNFSADALPNYLYYKIHTSLDNIHKHTSYATVKHLSSKQILNIEIPLPPLKEQERVVEILDRAENIKRLRQQAIETTQRVAPALFYEMFGNPVKNEKGWEISTLGSVSTIVRGASPRPIKEYLGGSVPWIKIGDATKGNDFYIRNTKEHITEEGAERSVVLDKGAVILSNSASIGFARILAMKGCIHDGWLSIDEYDKVFVDVFLIYLLDAFKGYLEHLAPHGTQKNLNTGILKNLEVPIPPIDEQREFVERVNTLNEHLQHQLESERQTKQLFSAFSAPLLAA